MTLMLTHTWPRRRRGKQGFGARTLPFFQMLFVLQVDENLVHLRGFLHRLFIELDLVLALGLDSRGATTLRRRRVQKQRNRVRGRDRVRFGCGYAALCSENRPHWMD